MAARDILEYVDYLRRERGNGASAVNRHVTVLKNFYRAIIAMDHLDHDLNPMTHFPRIKAAPVKLPVCLTEKEVGRLLQMPRTDTVLGLRDRSILTLLYGTGIRATECATLREADVDLVDRTIRVTGKGGHERVIPLNRTVAKTMLKYRQARGRMTPATEFFRSRSGGGMSRNAIYERVRKYSQLAKIQKRVSPHRLRHTFATHLVKRGIKLVTIRDLLGHRCIGSTQIYLHTTADDLRNAAAKHPIEKLIGQVGDLLPNVKLPFQWHPGEKVIGAG